MPFQLDKKKLMIGSGLLVILIIVVIVVVVMMKKESPPFVQPVQPFEMLQFVQPTPVGPISLLVYSKSFRQYIVANTQGGDVTWTLNASNATPFILGQDGTFSYNGYYLTGGEISQNGRTTVQTQPQKEIGGTLGALVSKSPIFLLRAYTLNSMTVFNSSGSQIQNVYVALDRNSSDTGLSTDLTNNYAISWTSGLKTPEIMIISGDSTNSFPQAIDPDNIIQLVPAYKILYQS
jgi:hypothetical protein